MNSPLIVGARANKVGASPIAAWWASQPRPASSEHAFKTTEGAERFVFEFGVPKGMLHLYSANQLEAVVERRGLE